MAVFKGAGVAIVTPMKDNGDIDFDVFAEQIEYQIANETDAIIVCGTTGETSTLTHDEHVEAIRFCVDTVKKRIPVVAGAGSNCTETEVFLTKEAYKCGADAVLLVSPYYNKGTQNGIYKHFEAAAKAADIPVILYNIQGRTGVNITPETVVKLCKDVDNIVGVKEASGNISQVAQIMHLSNGDIDLYSGNDDQIVPLLSLGGIGVISVLSNVAPKETHDICSLYLEDKVKESRDLQLRMLPLVDALFCEVNPIPVKAAIAMQGRGAGILRLPLTEMEPQNQKRLRAAMEELGLLP